METRKGFRTPSRAAERIRPHGGGEQAGLVDGVALFLISTAKLPTLTTGTERGDGRAERAQDGPGQPRHVPVEADDERVPGRRRAR